MFFTIVESHKFPPNARSRAFLVRDNWDDWRKYRTQFYLIVVDDSGEKHDIGSVKIGQVGLRPASIVEPGQRAPSVPVSFDNLGAEFFSVGQGEDYYLSLNQLSDALKTQVLVGLRDVAFDLEIFDANLAETVMTESLLRDVYESNVRFRLNRITRGDAQLTRFSFNYTLPVIEGVPPATMSFEVAPDSMPPTNVHVLIGRNGVGKTQCMRGLAQSLLNRRADEDKGLGKMVLFSDAGNDWSFAGVLLISFSAFDDFELRPLEGDAIRSTQVGLRRSLIQNGQSRSILKSPSDLATDFRDSLNQCRHGLKVDRWRSAVRTLETDDLFAEANITALLDLPDDNFRDGAAELLFSRLSSGHAIVLLTVTRLV